MIKGWGFIESYPGEPEPYIKREVYKAAKAVLDACEEAGIKFVIRNGGTEIMPRTALSVK